MHSFDTRLAVNYRLTKDMVASLSVDVFNLFNFQTATAYDQNYTYSPVLPIVGGTKADLPGRCWTRTTGAADLRRGHQQELRQTHRLPGARARFRFGARVTF